MLFNLTLNYNSKLDYLICKHIAGGFDDNCNELILRDCFYKKIAFINSADYKMCLIRDFFEENDVLTCSQKCIKEFINSMINVKLEDNLLKTVFNSFINLEERVITLSKSIDSYEEKHFVFRFIFFILYFREKKQLIIPYNGILQKMYSNALEENKIRINFLLNKLIKKTFKMNTPHSLEINKKVLGNILKYKDSFIKLINCQNIGIFGSFAMGTDNEYSDLDFIVIMEEECNFKIVKKITDCFWKNIIPLEMDIKVVKKDKINEQLTPAMLETLKIL